MKRTLIKTLPIILLLCILWGFTSCGIIVENPNKFIIENITDNPDKDYFSSEDYEFTRIETVVIIPHIMYSNGNYIYIEVCSETGSEQVLINQITLKENENDTLSANLNQEVTFEQKDESTYNGWVVKYLPHEALGEEPYLPWYKQMFVIDMIIPQKEKNFTLVVEAELLKDGESVSRTITYNVTMLPHEYTKW